MPAVVINGALREFDSLPPTILALLKALNLSPNGLIVEKNGEIFREASFENTPIYAQDTLEIVQFMGGGTLK